MIILKIKFSCQKIDLNIVINLTYFDKNKYDYSVYLFMFLYYNF